MAKGSTFQLVVKPPFRDVQGRFTKATAQLLQDYRVVVQAIGREYVTIAKREAPMKTGKFRNSISYRTAISGQQIRLEVLHLEPLGSYITKGTKRHIITGNPLLVFFWARGPDGPRTYFFRRVNHPGTKPNPYNERTWVKVKPRAEEMLRNIGRDWITRVT